MYKELIILLLLTCGDVKECCAGMRFDPKVSLSLSLEANGLYLLSSFCNNRSSHDFTLETEDLLDNALFLFLYYC